MRNYSLQPFSTDFCCRGLTLHVVPAICASFSLPLLEALLNIQRRAPYGADHASSRWQNWQVLKTPM